LAIDSQHASTYAGRRKLNVGRIFLNLRSDPDTPALAIAPLEPIRLRLSQSYSTEGTASPRRCCSVVESARTILGAGYWGGFRLLLPSFLIIHHQEHLLLPGPLGLLFTANSDGEDVFPMWRKLPFLAIAIHHMSILWLVYV